MPTARIRGLPMTWRAIMNDDNANNDDVNRPDWLGILAIIILIAFLAPAILAAIVPVALPVFIVGLLLWLIFKH